MKPFLGFAETVFRTPDRHLEPVVQIHLKQLFQGQGPGLPSTRATALMAKVSSSFVVR